MYRMGELQSGPELSFYCSYSKVRSKVLSLPKLCHWTTDLGHASYDLPDDVFAPGESKPTRPKKKVGKKRDLDAMEVRLQSPYLIDAVLEKVQNCQASHLLIGGFYGEGEIC